MNKGKKLAKYSLHGASGYAWEHPKIRTQETYMVLLNDSKNPVGENFAPLGSSEFFTWIILRTIFCLVGGRMVACCYPAIQKAPMCGIINLPIGLPSIFSPNVGTYSIYVEFLGI